MIIKPKLIFIEATTHTRVITVQTQNKTHAAVLPKVTVRIEVQLIKTPDFRWILTYIIISKAYWSKINADICSNTTICMIHYRIIAKIFKFYN